MVFFGAREARRMDRFAQFAVAHPGRPYKMPAWKSLMTTATASALSSAAASVASALCSTKSSFSWSVGLPGSSPFLVPMMLPDTGPGIVAIDLGLRGPNMAVVTACATGTNAIGEASEIVRRGDADVILAGGAEASIVPIAIAGLSNMKAVSTRNDDPQRAYSPL